ncbi:MAG TPA: hypothetical protein VMT74_09595 [Gaiellaceae bacterium]|nr:hypothetical protein [Gaiellaceae bacterium]
MVERRDVEAAVEARRELGPEYEDQIVDALAEKIEKRLDERLALQQRPARRHREPDMRVMLGSIALGVPVTAVALSNAHGAGGVVVAIIAWIAIAVANIAYMRF